MTDNFWNRPRGCADLLIFGPFILLFLLLLGGSCAGNQFFEDARETALRELAEQSAGYVSLHDMGVGFAPFCFETDCVETIDDIPGGDSYLAIGDDLSITPAIFELPINASSVSLAVTGVGDTTIVGRTLSGQIVDSATIGKVDFAEDWAGNVVSISGPNIRYVDVYAVAAVMDNLTFDGTVASFEDPDPVRDAWLPFAQGKAWYVRDTPHFVGNGVRLLAPSPNTLDGTVPEPSAMVLAVLGFAALLRRR